MQDLVCVSLHGESSLSHSNHHSARLDELPPFQTTFYRHIFLLSGCVYLRSLFLSFISS